MINEKRGLSPVIATILLIVIALILFLIIFMWLKGFQKETILKDNYPIETACRNINYEASYSGGIFEIRNAGSITISKIDIYKITGGSTDKAGNLTDIKPLNNARFSLNECEKIKAVPYLLGTTNKGEVREYACENEIQIINC